MSNWLRRPAVNRKRGISSGGCSKWKRFRSRNLSVRAAAAGSRWAKNSFTSASRMTFGLPEKPTRLSRLRIFGDSMRNCRTPVSAALGKMRWVTSEDSTPVIRGETGWNSQNRLGSGKLMRHRRQSASDNFLKREHETKHANSISDFHCLYDLGHRRRATLRSTGGSTSE